MLVKAEMKRSRRNFTQRLQQISGNRCSMICCLIPTTRLMIAPRIRRHSEYETFARNRRKVLRICGQSVYARSRFLFSDMGAPHMDVPTTSQLIRNAVTILERTGHTLEKGNPSR